jgi:hypothetical protein
VDRLEHEDGRSFIWLVSQSREEVTVKPVTADGGSLRTLDGVDVDRITLPRYGVQVLEWHADR